MKRRNLLKSLGLGLSAGLIMPELLISCSKPDLGPEINYEGTVAIIGAGAAGLYAADILRSKGIAVTIFEAAPKLGGRIKSYRAPKNTDSVTDSFFFLKWVSTPDPDHPTVTEDISEPSAADFPLELGAQTILGVNSIWGKMMKDLGMQMVDITDAPDEFILDNVSKTGADWSGDADYNAVQTFVAALPTQTGSGTSVTAASGISGRGLPLVNALAGNYYGSSSDLIDAGLLGSELAVAKAQSNYDDHELVLTSTLMQDILYSRFVNVAKFINLNTEIKSVNYGSDKITLTDAAGVQTEVDKVIVTVPLTVLKSNAISFSPGLPSAMTSSLTKFGMDGCIRMILDFKTNFWGDDTTGFIWGGTETPQMFNAAIGRSTIFRTLTFTICGPKAAEFSALAPLAMVQKVLDALDLIYDGKATTNIRKTLEVDPQIIYTIQDWSKEPFINGAFSYPLVGAAETDRVAIGQPVNGKLFFAGEATDVTGNAGTINGALASAERVATEVVNSIVL